MGVGHVVSVVLAAPVLACESGIETAGRQTTTARRQFAATSFRKSARWARLAGCEEWVSAMKILGNGQDFQSGGRRLAWCALVSRMPIFSAGACADRPLKPFPRAVY